VDDLLNHRREAGVKEKIKGRSKVVR